MKASNDWSLHNWDYRHVWGQFHRCGAKCAPVKMFVTVECERWNQIMSISKFWSLNPHRNEMTEKKLWKWQCLCSGLEAHFSTLCLGPACNFGRGGANRPRLKLTLKRERLAATLSLARSSSFSSSAAEGRGHEDIGNFDKLWMSSP